jgi:hypothetical protein
MFLPKFSYSSYQYDVTSTLYEAHIEIYRFYLKKECISYYKTIILPVPSYGCETWSLTLREEHILKVFENMVLRRIFGPKREEVEVGWRSQNKDLHNLHDT